MRVAGAGHTSWTTTQRYASHLPTGATKTAIETMEKAEVIGPVQRETGTGG
jgi:hypothetical protein